LYAKRAITVLLDLGDQGFGFYSIACVVNHYREAIFGEALRNRGTDAA
jgi:hypothetical protein